MADASKLQNGQLFALSSTAAKTRLAKTLNRQRARGPLLCPCAPEKSTYLLIRKGKEVGGSRGDLRGFHTTLRDVYLLKPVDLGAD